MEYIPALTATRGGITIAVIEVKKADTSKVFTTP